MTVNLSAKFNEIIWCPTYNAVNCITWPHWHISTLHCATTCVRDDAVVWNTSTQSISELITILTVTSVTAGIVSATFSYCSRSTWSKSTFTLVHICTINSKHMLTIIPSFSRTLQSALQNRSAIVIICRLSVSLSVVNDASVLWQSGCG